MNATPASATATATPTLPLPTVTPTPVACSGECNGNDEVTVDELIMGINIALGTATIGQCPGFGCNGNHKVSVDCLMRAVDAALTGCDR